MFFVRLDHHNTDRLLGPKVEIALVVFPKDIATRYGRIGKVSQPFDYQPAFYQPSYAAAVVCLLCLYELKRKNHPCFTLLTKRIFKTCNNLLTNISLGFLKTS